MPVFNFKALDNSGKLISGKEMAESITSCKALLRKRDLIPLEITSEIDESLFSVDKFLKHLWRRRLSSIVIGMILRQLSTLLGAGVPIHEALKLMIEQSENEFQKRVLSEWSAGLLEGKSISEAVSCGQFKLPEDIAAAMSVAEQTGHLDKVLERLADEQERRLDNQKILQSALIYPSLLIVTSITVLVFVMTSIVPKVVAMFESQHAQLPLVTKIVMATSSFLIDYGVILLALLLMALAWLSIILRKPHLRLRFDWVVLQLPFIGEVVKLRNLADWCRHLSMMLAAGVPAIQSLKIANKTLANHAIFYQMSQVLTSVDRGEKLHTALSSQSLIPGFMLHLVGSGEAGSKLGEMLNKVAEYYSRQLTSKTDTFLKILNPVLLIIIAGIITLIILGVITPIMQMNSMI